MAKQPKSKGWGKPDEGMEHMHSREFHNSGDGCKCGCGRVWLDGARCRGHVVSGGVASRGRVDTDLWRMLVDADAEFVGCTSR